jgi:hypothetical protein
MVGASLCEVNRRHDAASRANTQPEPLRFNSSRFYRPGDRTVRDDGNVTDPQEPADASVLANLPRRRPQRRSPKRDPGPGPGPASAGAEPRRARSAPQGYEADAARGPVEPPSGPDLIGAVVEGVGDLAHIGLDAGRQILRSVLRRLPLP